RVVRIAVRGPASKADWRMLMGGIEPAGIGVPFVGKHAPVPLRDARNSARARRGAGSPAWASTIADRADAGRACAQRFRRKRGALAGGGRASVSARLSTVSMGAGKSNARVGGSA